MYVVTGATGKFGTLAVEGLVNQVPVEQIAVVVRDPAKAARFGELGVEVRKGDYSDPASLADAFREGDRVLFVSGSEVGQRVPQHKAVIDAAKAAGVALLAYTSVLGGPAADFELAREHQITERYLIDSGVPYALLRNGWYHEVYTEALGQSVANGGLLTSAAEGSRVASAARADYAAAGVAVLTGEGHEGAEYELSGDEAWSFEEFAAEVSRVIGKDFPVNRVTPEAHRGILESVGLPPTLAPVIAGIDDAISRGLLAGTSGDLSRLIGRPTTPIADAIAQSAKNL
ncbi:SDR family oxidoreductase [Glycomyces artemisiae]|uniref:NAD(P)H dehydrogenase (Quinone) n=2 Tax=Glycomyces artemisiae TaxID=1076443 RepID=A0A2T0UB08_9ACTN|nr:SDR family oxidoreductase [Glycomyces artemisiae]PRY54997.1 NAD(P)H dehydrogenase (quinone) [Glycomyces artemisiae]